MPADAVQCHWRSPRDAAAVLRRASALASHQVDLSASANTNASPPLPQATSQPSAQPANSSRRPQPQPQLASRKRALSHARKSLAPDLQPIQMQPTRRRPARPTARPSLASLCVFVAATSGMIRLVGVAAQRAPSNAFAASSEPTSDVAEARGEHMMRPQLAAIDQLFNILSQYSNNQQQQTALNRPAGQQRPLLAPQLQSQVVSTSPANPFAAAQFQQPPNRRIHLPTAQLTNLQRLNQNQNQNQAAGQSQNGNQANNQAAGNLSPMLIASSSPPTPYLTLNRLSSLANQQQQLANQNNVNSRPQINLQPLNTIPLGNINANTNNNQQPQFGGRSPVSALMPPRGMQPARPQPQYGPSQSQQPQPQQQQHQQSMQRLPNVPLPASAHVQAPPANQVKPISGGFAPSGPPPSPGVANAMVVVPSPTSAGPGPPLATSGAQQEASDASATVWSVASSTQAASGSTSSTTPASTTARAPQLVSSSGASPAGASLDSNKQSTTTEVSSSAPPAPATITGAPDLADTHTDGAQQGGVSSWSPLEANRSAPGEHTQRPRVALAPSPDIVTVPPGYNPDAANNVPDSYDIAVSAKMGGSGGSARQPAEVAPASGSPAASTTMLIAEQASSSAEATPVMPTVSPTEVTTIIWSPPASDTPASSVSATPSATVAPTRTLDAAHRLATQTGAPSSTAPSATSAGPASTATPTSTLPTRIRDNSLNDEPAAASGGSQSGDESGVVYGKAQTRDSKPAAPGQSAESAGRPFIKPAPIDSQVRPYVAGAARDSHQANQHQLLHKSNHHAPFKTSRPINGQQAAPMHIGSGFTIMAAGNQTMPTGDIQDYAAGQPPTVLGPAPAGHIGGSFQVSNEGAGGAEPTISAHGGPDPFDLNAQDSSAAPARSTSTSANSSAPATSGSAPEAAGGVPPALGSSTSAPRLRRPTFKPKPAEPPIRIDSCIVGDESSCEQAHNERCVTEYGISSCHCKPGFARLSQLRGYCSPVSLLQMTLRIERLSDDRRLAYNASLENPNTEEYQYMEFETIQAVAGAFTMTGLAKQYMGARVNKFFEHKGKVWANVSVNLEASNVTKSARVQQLAGQELAKAVQSRAFKALGDSTVMLDGSSSSVSRLMDVNECANADLNDCSKQATCTNEFGGFQCQCLAGYEDKHATKERTKQGRVCLGCSASYCSNRGECTIVDGQKQCKCRANFIGSRCDIDSEVMAVAVGGSLVGVIILIVTFWCLFVFNRRWKREQQKMDAMSATSGLTFNYVNSSTNSLMSPSRALVGGLHRAAAAGVGPVGGAALYTQRLGAAGRAAAAAAGHSHYAADQQAIMGSTSSGSSAASQPIGCHAYAPAPFQYEDAGLLIAPASTGSSEQTSPASGTSYRTNAAAAAAHQLAQMAGTAYTLSGHHHLNHHHNNNNHSHHQHHLHHMTQQAHSKGHPQLTQFHPAADYRTMNAATMQHQQQHCHGGAYADNAARWRTLQQDAGAAKQSALVGYYLSPDMLVNHQQHQQLYASPQRELCIDTDAHQATGRGRRQQGRANAHTLRSRSQLNQTHQSRGSMYATGAIDYEHERPI